MNREEMETVLTIMAHADGCCHVCARYLFEEFIEKFPDSKELAKRVYGKEFESELDED